MALEAGWQIRASLRSMYPSVKGHGTLIVIASKNGLRRERLHELRGIASRQSARVVPDRQVGLPPADAEYRGKQAGERETG